MRLYLKISPDELTERNKLIEELVPICAAISESAEWVRCYPISGNTLQVVDVLNKYEIHFEIEIEREQ